MHTCLYIQKWPCNFHTFENTCYDTKSSSWPIRLVNFVREFFSTWSMVRESTKGGHTETFSLEGGQICLPTRAWQMCIINCKLPKIIPSLVWSVAPKWDTFAHQTMTGVSAQLVEQRAELVKSSTRKTGAEEMWFVCSILAVRGTSKYKLHYLKWNNWYI